MIKRPYVSRTLFPLSSCMATDSPGRAVLVGLRTHHRTMQILSEEAYEERQTKPKHAPGLLTRRVRLEK